MLIWKNRSRSKKAVNFKIGLVAGWFIGMFLYYLWGFIKNFF